MVAISWWLKGICCITVAAISSECLHIGDVQNTEVTSRNVKKKTKYIIDTDAGVDDAFAIIAAVQEAVSRPDEVEIVAITCVAGNTALSNVEINVLKTLHTLNATHIPVYSGANGSLIVTPPSDNYFGMDGFGDFDYPNPPSRDEIQKENAVNAMIRLAKENPGEIEILAIAPLTNIALAIRLDPMFRSYLKRISILGGALEHYGNVGEGLEFNFFMDPEANFIVLNTTEEGKLNLLLPWETVDVYALISNDWRINVLGKINSTLVKFVNKAENKVFESPTHDNWRSSDCMLAVSVLRPEIVDKTEQHHVDAILHGAKRGGLLVDQNTVYDNIIAIKQIHIELYKNILLQYFS